MLRERIRQELRAKVEAERAAGSGPAAGKEKKGAADKNTSPAKDAPKALTPGPKKARGKSKAGAEEGEPGEKPKKASPKAKLEEASPPGPKTTRGKRKADPPEPEEGEEAAGRGDSDIAPAPATTVPSHRPCWKSSVAADWPALKTEAMDAAGKKDGSPGRSNASAVTEPAKASAT
mmetsp:Transcript_57262/g.127795  ORF Transcript_57262/g.127795 Transcript_57262/m.127795 type:complete len:176 (+) Transcript_57262:1-528(+)